MHTTLFNTGSSYLLLRLLLDLSWSLYLSLALPRGGERLLFLLRRLSLSLLRLRLLSLTPLSTMRQKRKRWKGYSTASINYLHVLKEDAARLFLPQRLFALIGVVTPPPIVLTTPTPVSTAIGLLQMEMEAILHQYLGAVPLRDFKWTQEESVSMLFQDSHIIIYAYHINDLYPSFHAEPTEHIFHSQPKTHSWQCMWQLSRSFSIQLITWRRS